MLPFEINPANKVDCASAAAAGARDGVTIRGIAHLDASSGAGIAHVTFRFAAAWLGLCAFRAGKWLIRFIVSYRPRFGAMDGW